MIRLLLVDDHAVVREGVKRILTGVPDIRVAGEAENARQTYAILADETFDLVLLDVSLPQHNGLEILTHIRSAYPDLPVLIFSVHRERQYVVRALQEGAAGYLLKSSAPRELVTALRQIARGERYVSAELIDSLVQEVADTESPLHESLTPREHQVMHRLVAGQALKEIAHELGLSIKTVSTHRRRLLDKLCLNNTPDLVRYVIQHGLTE